MDVPDGFELTVVLERADPRDALVGKGFQSLDDIPQGATFGTSSLRRSAQLLMLRPDINIVPLRGNVQTRLDKLEKGEMWATMLASSVCTAPWLTITNAITQQIGSSTRVIKRMKSR